VGFLSALSLKQAMAQCPASPQLTHRGSWLLDVVDMVKVETLWLIEIASARTKAGRYRGSGGLAGDEAMVSTCRSRSVGAQGGRGQLGRARIRLVVWWFVDGGGP